ncbi:MAG TPA: PAS domain S-box protein, partial [Nitrospirota bacterium]
MEKMPLDKFRLRFPDKVEADFQEDYFQKSLFPLRLGIALGAALYAVFGILDAYVTPEVAHQTWFVRYLVVLPACAAVLLFSRSPHFKKYMQAALLSLVLVGGGGIVAMLVIVRSPVNYFHFAGLLLVIMYSYTFSKLRFLYTCLASWSLVGMYEIAALGIIHTPLPVFLNDNFFYVAANLIGMFSSYHREWYMRRDFFQNQLIQESENQKNIAEKETLHEVAEKAILSFRESEEKFLALADTAAIAIFIHQGGNFLYANRMAEIIGGYTVDEYLQMNFLDLIHPEYREMIQERARERLAGGRVPSQYEFKIMRKDGQERWVLMTAGLMENEDKPAIISTLIDITLRKQAEQERERFYQELQKTARSLRESEAKFRSLAETAPAAIFIHDGGKFLYANAACLVMTGYTREALLTMHFWDVIYSDDREMVRQRGRARVNGESAPERYEFRVIAKSGEVRWLDMTAVVIEYEGKQAVLGNAFDITDRKKAAEERERLNRQLQQALQSLRESESKFRTLAETTTAAIFIHQGGKILYANPAGGTVAGYTNEEFLSMDFWTIVHPAFQRLVLERARARLHGDSTPPAYEFKIITKTGDERWVLMTAGVIAYEGKPAVIGTLFDITDRKEAEEERVKLCEQRIVEEKRHLMEKEKLLMDLHD